MNSKIGDILVFYLINSFSLKRKTRVVMAILRTFIPRNAKNRMYFLWPRIVFLPIYQCNSVLELGVHPKKSRTSPCHSFLSISGVDSCRPSGSLRFPARLSFYGVKSPPPPPPILDHFMKRITYPKSTIARKQLSVMVKG